MTVRSRIRAVDAFMVYSFGLDRRPHPYEPGRARAVPSIHDPRGVRGRFVRTAACRPEAPNTLQVQPIRLGFELPDVLVTT